VQLCYVIGIWLNFNAGPKFRGLSSKIMWAKKTQNLGRFCSTSYTVNY